MPQMPAPHWSIFIAVEDGHLYIETSPKGASAAEVAAICAAAAAQLAPPPAADAPATPEAQPDPTPAE